MGVKDVDSRMTASRPDLQSLRTVPLQSVGEGNG